MSARVRTRRLVIAFGVMLSFVHGSAGADVVLQWNEIAFRTLGTPPLNPFAQARYLAMTQLAVFEAVNAVNGGYEPYVDGIAKHPDASAEAAAITAAYEVLTTVVATDPAFMSTRQALLASLATDLASSLAAVSGSGKQAGIALGEQTAAAILALRENDGSAPIPPFIPSSALPGAWRLTPNCAGGVFYQWSGVTPFGIPAAEQFVPAPPPNLLSTRYAKDYLEVKTVGAVNSTARPADRADVARYYAAISPGTALNMAAIQLSTGRGDSLAENARALALLNMAINDALIVSFKTKYQYGFWRPVTAIQLGDTDGNRKTDPDSAFVPFIATPCFPSYPSNHASGTNGGLEILRRVYGAAGHSLVLVHPTLPDPQHPTRKMTLYYSALRQIADDVDDARVYGGIHFRFDQEEGSRLGREVATFVYKHNLRRIGAPD